MMTKRDAERGGALPMIVGVALAAALVLGIVGAPLAAEVRLMFFDPASGYERLVVPSGREIYVARQPALTVPASDIVSVVIQRTRGAGTSGQRGWTTTASAARSLLNGLSQRGQLERRFDQGVGAVAGGGGAADPHFGQCCQSGSSGA